MNIIQSFWCVLKILFVAFGTSVLFSMSVSYKSWHIYQYCDWKISIVKFISHIIHPAYHISHTCVTCSANHLQKTFGHLNVALINKWCLMATIMNSMKWLINNIVNFMLVWSQPCMHNLSNRLLPWIYSTYSVQYSMWAGFQKIELNSSFLL